MDLGSKILFAFIGAVGLFWGMAFLEKQAMTTQRNLEISNSFNSDQITKTHIKVWTGSETPLDHKFSFDMNISTLSTISETQTWQVSCHFHNDDTLTVRNNFHQNNKGTCNTKCLENLRTACIRHQNTAKE